MNNIQLNGAKNVRDLGGMKAGKKTVKPHMLLRADCLYRLSDADLDKLILEYKLKSVIDLRIETEKREKPDRLINVINYYEMPIFDDSLPGLSHESKQQLDAVPDLRELYEYVMNSACLDNLAAVVRKIVTASDEDYAFLYHCTEGKDRTGMVTALLLLLLGVSREAILQDYFFTNSVNKKKAVKYFLLVRIFKRNKTAAKRVYNVFLAREEYLNEVFKAVDKIGMEAFTKDILKLTEEEVADFRARLLA